MQPLSLMKAFYTPTMQHGLDEQALHKQSLMYSNKPSFMYSNWTVQCSDPREIAVLAGCCTHNRALCAQHNCHLNVLLEQQLAWPMKLKLLFGLYNLHFLSFYATLLCVTQPAKEKQSNSF